MNSTTAHISYIYIITCEGSNRIKIGFSINPYKRVYELQTGAPGPLTVFATWLGDIQDEQQIHRLLAAHRKHLEWFELHPNDAVVAIEKYFSEKPVPLTIFDAPNVCRDIMAKSEALAKHPDPTVAKTAESIGKDAKQMLDLILSATEQLLLENVAYELA